MPTVVLQPNEAASKDAYVDSNSPLNFNNTTLRARREGGAYRFRAFVQFDVLGSVPVNAGIVSAVLTLWGDPGAGGSAIDVDVREITGTWTETLVTRANQPGVGITVGQIAFPGANNPVSLDVRSSVQKWVREDLDNNGWRLSAENETSIPNDGHVYSSSQGPGGTWPRLTIVYANPPTPTEAEVLSSPGGSYNRVLSGGAGGFLTYVTPDGREYPLHTPHQFGRWVINFSGWGTPPIEYITQRGPFQHGDTVKDYFLRPRVVQVLIRQGFMNRTDWWQGREDLLNEIRPNRQATATGALPGQLRIIQTDGTTRDLDVYIQEGPRFEPREPNRWDEHAIQEVLRFVAYDPVLYDPSQVTAAFVITLDAELVFPITFPITFGAGEVDDALNITYPGTWMSFPVITIVGPLENFRLDNESTDEKIELSIDIPAGRTVTIDLTEGQKTVVDDLGTNLVGTVTTDSDLGTFHIAADPVAAGGVNALRLRGDHPTGATTVSLAYFDRYFGT